MTPDELELISADGRAVRVTADAFASRFYDTLFEIAPQTRELFPDDLVGQRGKLVNELAFLVDAATASSGDDDAGGLAGFTDRARQLGRRHVGYGVRGADYGPVGRALLAALRDTLDDWDDRHEQAWSKLYRLIADVMRDGASAGVASS